MSSNNPFFSVIIPCYNCAKYLPECLNSLITQDYTQWEAIKIMMDGEKMKRLKEPLKR